MFPDLERWSSGTALTNRLANRFTKRYRILTSNYHVQGALEGKTLVNKRSIVSVNVSNIVRILFDFAGNFYNFEVCVGRDEGSGDGKRY